MSKSKKQDKQRHKPTTLENFFFGCTLQELPSLIPGVLLVVALVALSIILTNLLNSMLGFTGLISFILVVIILGIVLRNLIPVPAICIPGITFSVKKLLRLGIILMGIRLSIFDVLKIGAWGIPIVLVCILTGLVLTVYFSRLLRIPERLATLVAVGTGICGVSAIVATAPGIDAKDEEVSYAVANITVFGLIALVTYPLVMHWVFHANTTMIGLFLGTSIHETAQVAASGLIYDQTFNAVTYPTALDVATVTKLVRNVMMALIIPAMTFLYSKRAEDIQPGHTSGFKKAVQLFPIFIIGFLVMAILRSLGDSGLRASGTAFGLWDRAYWAAIHSGIKEWSGYFLATAMAGVGLSTSFKTMKGLGIKPFYVGLFAAIMVGVVAFIMVFALGRFITI